MSKLKIYLKSILLPVIIGIIVGLITSSFNDYDTLQKPFGSPPAIAFPIVWTILYILMGISYAMLKSKKLADSEADTIYYSQLFVNALWSIIFFVFKWRFFAFIWILLLAFLVYRMITIFYKKDKTAGLLQVPYLVWVIFATYLNLSFYLLNR